MALGESPAEPSRAVLVVDDEEVVLSVLEMYLSRLGYRTVKAASAEAALEVARSGEEIVLAIIDLSMPGMAGSELFSLLRQIRPELRAIITSGHGLNAAAEGLLAAGADGFLAKPFEIEDLCWAIHQACGSAPGT